MQISELRNQKGTIEVGTAYETLIQNALSNPGTIAKCYKLFHSYSFLNTMFASMQMENDGIDLTPIGTFNKWKSLGKHVKKGAKAIAVIYPVIGYFFKEEEDKDTGKKVVIKIPRVKGFEIKRTHFAYSQCREYGKEDEIQRVSLDVDWVKVLKTLDIKQIKWGACEGNAQGYAIPLQRAIAINPLNTNKDKTMVHEIAHVLLHGSDERFTDNEVLVRDTKEVQAELTAYLVLSMLGCSNEEVMSESRGYIQNWLGDNKISEKEIKPVVKAAEMIMAAATDKKTKDNKKGE
jgi:antirestriction protein ArdC